MNQNEQRRRTTSLIQGGILILAACAVTALRPAQAGNSVNLTFRYTVVQGTCTLNVPATLPMGTIDNPESAVGKNWVFLNPKTLDVTLSDCQGDPLGSTRPAIKLTAPVATSGSADRQKYLATSATGSSGFGVVIAKKGLAPVTGSVSNLTPLTSGDAYIDLGALNTTAQNGTTTLNVALACGAAADCAVNNLSAGTDKVSIRFEFAYH